MSLNRGTNITYCGHSTFKITSPKGKAVLIDPWLSSNPACPENLKKTDRLDLMLITHGHFDHIADAVELGTRLKPHTLTVYEIGLWLEGKGVPNVTGMGRGGTVDVDGIRCTLVQAFHSSSIKDGDQVIYGGEPGGFVIQFENGFTVYHAGDTNVFGDMKIIADLYAPELVMLPIGDLYTMSPKEAAYACKLLSPKWVIPIHYATFPPLTGRPEQLRDLTKDMKGLEVLALKPGETLT
jgi:L-ascorbate metabolism protein UlaG (beta-lactamase superfamily)